MSLVVLIGASGSGKSTFARKHFLPTEIISSDCLPRAGLRRRERLRCHRRRVRGRPLPRAQAPGAPEAHGHRRDQRAAARRASRWSRSRASTTDAGRDRARPAGASCATSATRPARPPVRAPRRAPARSAAAAVAARSAARGVPLRHRARLARGDRRGRRSSARGCGTTAATITGRSTSSATSTAASTSSSSCSRARLPGRRDAPARRHPTGRKARVPRRPRRSRPGHRRPCCELVMNMVARRHRALRSRQPRDQAAQEAPGPRRQDDARSRGDAGAARARAARVPRRRSPTFIDKLVSHYVLDDGKLVVAHAGMKAEHAGPRVGARARVRALRRDDRRDATSSACRSATTGPREYRGPAMVVYGHTPVPEAEWLNRTICIDTGCVFGGKLTALRYPEKELVSVPAAAHVLRAGEARCRSAAGCRAAARARRSARHRRRPGQARSIATRAAPQRHGPRGERRGRARGDEPVRGRSALARSTCRRRCRRPRRCKQRRLPRAPGGGVRVLPQARASAA